MYAYVCHDGHVCLCRRALGAKEALAFWAPQPSFPCGVAQALTRCEGPFYLHCMRPRARALHTYRPFSCRTISVDG